ncbi:hypothetical protein T01_16127, partial [Trichinella spiralis]
LLQLLTPLNLAGLLLLLLFFCTQHIVTSYTDPTFLRAGGAVFDVIFPGLVGVST